MATKAQWLTRTLLAAGFLIYCCHEYFSFTGSLGFQPQRFREALSQHDVEIVRDAYGVPTVFGADDVDVSFGLGYAQAQDRLEDIEKAVIRYRGESARFYGSDELATDHLIQMLGVWQKIESGQAAQQLPEGTLQMLEAFAQGVNAYAGIDINRSKAAIYPITKEDLLAAYYLQPLFAYGFDEQLADEVERVTGTSVKPSEMAPLARFGGGNALALSSDLSGDEASYLAWNMHQPIAGPQALYEAGVSSSTGWQFHGGFFPGSPIPIIGVSPKLAWGVTAVKPKLVKLLPIDGRDVIARECSVEVKVFGAFTWPNVRTCFEHDAEPVMRLGDRYFAVDYAALDKFSQAEQWFRMGRAENVDEWRDAFKLAALTGYNFVVADAAGSVGFMQQALEVGELDSTVDSALVSHIAESRALVVAADNWIGDVAAGTDNPLMKMPPPINNRALRAAELLAQNKPMSWGDFKAIKYDHYYSVHSEQFQKVHQALSLASAESDSKAYQVAARWDGGTDVENTSAALALCLIDQPLNAAALNQCASHLVNQFGRVDVPWGVVSRLVKGGSYWALSGAPDTFRSVYADPSDLANYGFRRAVYGDGLHGFVSFSDGELVRAEVIAPLGQSTAKKSKYQSDQAPMFANKQLREISFDRDKLYQQAVEVFRPEDAY